MRIAAAGIAVLLAAPASIPVSIPASMPAFAAGELKPKFGDIGGVYYSDIADNREACRQAIENKIALCRRNTSFVSNTNDRKYPGCLPVFRRQAQSCIAHFRYQMGKCEGSGATRITDFTGFACEVTVTVVEEGGEPDRANNAGGAAQSGQWDDAAGSGGDGGWGPDAAMPGSGAPSAGGTGAAGVPAYAAALEKLEGRGKAGPAAPVDGYVAAIDRLEKREAERRRAAQRPAGREAARLRTGTARKQSQKRAARSAAERQRRQAARDRAARDRAAQRAARSKRDREAERARRARAEGQRRSKALLNRNLKMAGLRRKLNREISNCNSRAQEWLNRELAMSRTMSVVCRGASCVQRARIRYANQARNNVPIYRRQCEARARSAYRRSLAALLAQKY